jgi:hypothetical protein
MEFTAIKPFNFTRDIIAIFKNGEISFGRKQLTSGGPGECDQKHAYEDITEPCGKAVCEATHILE